MTTRFTSRILIRLGVKDEASPKLTKFEENVKKTQRTVGIAFTAMAAAGFLVGRSAVTAAIEQQSALRVLAAAVDATGASWADQRKEIIATTRALEAKTAIGDEEQIRALVTLTNALGSSKQALQALPLALDASAASGRSLEAVVNTLGRALAGQVNTSISLNTTFQKTQSFQSRLAQGFGIVEGSAEANADAIKRLSSTMGTLNETLGAALLPTVTLLFAGLGKIAVAIQTFAENNQLLVSILAPILVGLVLLAAIVGPLLLILPGIAVAVGFVSLAMFGWVIAIALVVAALIALTVIVVKNWDKIREVVVGTINVIIRAINALVEALFQLSGFGILNRISGALGGPSISGVPNIPTITTMDTGGTVKGPGMFKVGPGVTEIVRTPGGGGGGGGVTINIPASSLLVLNDRSSMRKFASVIERELTQSGRGRRRLAN